MVYFNTGEEDCAAIVAREREGEGEGGRERKREKEREREMDTERETQREYTTIWGPNIQFMNSVGNIPYLNHNVFLSHGGLNDIHQDSCLPGSLGCNLAWK